MSRKASFITSTQIPFISCGLSFVNKCWKKPVYQVVASLLAWCTNRCNNSQQCWDLDCILGRIQTIGRCKLEGDDVQCGCVAPKMFEGLCKQIQRCCATPRRSWNKRTVKSCWLKSLTGFKLCATTPNNTQQHATRCANEHIFACSMPDLGALLLSHASNFCFNA